ncbi:MAG: SDR family oxidoreductase [Candidatus Lindowbacteria bacterium]|nr:SDR family oxidoreductase [Candidatus Lindowbacteria bacterium]
MNTVFITGGTGLLGRAVVRRLLQGDESVAVKLLVRASSEEMLQARIERLLQYLGINFRDPGVRARVEGIRGDITLPRMGLSDTQYRELALGVKGILHIAACTKWGLPLEDLKEVNVSGTERVAEFARTAAQEGGLKFFAHVSTAYVAGDRTGVIREAELWEGQQFNNNYERSKFEGEMLVQNIKEDVPTVVLRPSMIIGDSQTGETPNFNVFYYIVKLSVKGRLPALPTRGSAFVDLIPSDYAAAALYEIVNQTTSIGKTFHLCSGPDRTPTMDEILGLMRTYFSQHSAQNGENRHRPPMMLNPTMYKYFVAPLLKATLPAKQRERMTNVELYIPYTTSRKIFDISNTIAATDELGAALPLLQEYYSNIFQFCLDTDWKGKGPVV